MAQSKSFSSNSVLFVASRKITNGFDGWTTEPTMTATAKSLVCEPDKFIERYGTYYKTGLITGSYLRILYDVKGVEDKSAFVTEASGGGGGWGVSVSAAFGKAENR
jgi:hypothetical protein